MKKIFGIILIASLVISCTSKNKVQNSNKVVDVDKISCSWNKNSQEQEEQCQPDPNKKTIGKKLDKRLNKDAKKIKKFFGIGKNKETETEEKQE